MKKIPLSRDKFALVDDEDYERINKHNWSGASQYVNSSCSRLNGFGQHLDPFSNEATG